MYDRPSEEEEEPSRSVEPRHSIRNKRPNPKYANDAITEEENTTETQTFEEAQLRVEWNKVMEEEFVALDLGAYIKTDRCEAYFMQMGL